MAAALLAGPAGDAVQAAPQVAASTTTLQTMTSASAEIHLSAPTTFEVSAGPDSDLSVEGRGRVVAAALRRVGSTKPGEAFTVAKFNACGGSGCTPPPDEPAHVYARSADGQNRDAAGRAVLQPGAYRLAVLADGAPVTVTLRFAGQPSATTTLTADDFLSSGVAAADETASVPLSPSYWSGGASLIIPTPDSILLGFLQQDSPLGTVVGAAGACHFAGPTPLLGHYAPGCPFNPGPSGNVQVGSLSTEQLTLGSSERARMATFLPAVQGGQQAGFWSARAGLTAAPVSYFAWLSLG